MDHRNEQKHETASKIIGVFHFSISQKLLHTGLNVLSLDLGHRTEQSRKVDPRNPMQLDIANTL